MIHENVEFDFYFIRHGESQSNVTPGIAAGINFDAPMTEDHPGVWGLYKL